jgi:hypothetical protein
MERQSVIMFGRNMREGGEAIWDKVRTERERRWREEGENSADRGREGENEVYIPELVSYCEEDGKR